MSHVQLSDIFRVDYLATVTAHIKRVQAILDEYDVAIFMARKAICFYDALISNNEIVNKGCRVVSSRIIYYNTLDSYRGKKIAVVDDVVVRGNSLNRVATKLYEAGINADYYVAVCEEKFSEEFECKYSLSIQSHINYPRKDIYHFSSLITQYIEASMRTFNVDSPIYTITNSIEYIDDILEKSCAVHLSSGLQNKYGIKSRSIYFKYTSNPDTNPIIDKALSESIIKIRFYYDDRRAVAVPFVLLSACESNKLDELYNLLISSNTLDELIKNDNERVVEENKHKLISYFLSDALFYNFKEKYKLDCNRDVLNDILQFDKNMDDITPDNAIELVRVMNNARIYAAPLSSFIMTEYIRDAYDFVAKRNPELQEYEDSTGELFGLNNSHDEGKLSQIAFSFSDIYRWIENLHQNESYNLAYTSSVIDVFVDMGFIVPAILHTSNNITLRAYKMGEYSKLTRDQINSFIFMLKTYQDEIDQYFDKIEFEKLCVLFYKSNLKQGVFAEQSAFEEGCYSIAYSFYGPRLSTAKTLYSTSKNSVFVTDLIDEEILRTTQDKYNRWKYYLAYNKNVNDDFLEMSSIAFARDYSTLKKVFVDHPYVSRKKSNDSSVEHWNQYVHTYNQFLTLLAVGNNIKDQILSLCAEIVMVTKLDEKMFFDDIDKLDMGYYCLYLSGINSGIWKYWCYTGDALKKTLLIISKYYNSFASVAYNALGPSDCSAEVKAFLKECGDFLYKAVYIINELLLLTGRVQYFNLDRLDGDSYNSSSNETYSNDNPTIFDMGCYYNDKMGDLRKSLCNKLDNYYSTHDQRKTISGYMSLLQNSGKMILDKCDLYLDTTNANSVFVEEFLIVHAQDSNLPNSFGNNKPCILYDISDVSSTAVFSIQNINEMQDVVSEVIEATKDIVNCHYLLIHQKNNKFGYTQVLNRAKGSTIIDEIKKMIDCTVKTQYTGKYLFVYQKGNDNPLSFSRIENVRIELQDNKQYNNRMYLYTYSIHNKKRVDNMETNNLRDIKIGDNAVVIGSNFGQSGDGNQSTVMVNSQIEIKTINEKIEIVRKELDKDSELSDEDKDLASINIDAIEKEVNKEIPKKSKIQAAIKALSAIKGSVEFAAAVATLYQLIMYLGLLP